MTNEHEYNDIQYAGFWPDAVTDAQHFWLVINSQGEFMLFTEFLSRTGERFKVKYDLDKWKLGEVVSVGGPALFKVIEILPDHVIMQSLKED